MTTLDDMVPNSGATGPADITSINTVLDANADWFAESSITKCAAWITAATQLLHRAEESQRTGQGTGARLKMNLEQLREEIKFARRWYANASAAASNTGGNAIGSDFTYTDGRY